MSEPRDEQQIAEPKEFDELHRWEIEPHPDTDYDTLVTDSDNEARQHILDIAERHLWDGIESGQERVMKVRMNDVPTTDAKPEQQIAKCLNHCGHDLSWVRNGHCNKELWNKASLLGYCGHVCTFAPEQQIGYHRVLCSKCGEGLGFSEGDPCDRCTSEQQIAPEATELAGCPWCGNVPDAPYTNNVGETYARLRHEEGCCLGLGETFRREQWIPGSAFEAWNTRVGSVREATDEIVDEVQRRMDAVVDAAVEWHQDESGDWSQKSEILGDAIEALLELRDPPYGHNAEFIAAARNLAPRLVERVKQQAELITELKEALAVLGVEVIGKRVTNKLCFCKAPGIHCAKQPQCVTANAALAKVED